MSTEQDNLLFSKLKQGDRQAFNQLFTKHYNRLCNFARGIFKRDDLAEETVQEVFINLWEQKEKIDVTKSVIAFLYTCVRNNAYNRIEKDKTRKVYEERFMQKSNHVVEIDLNDESGNQLIRLLKQAIELLPKKCREIFMMSRFEGLTYEEISEYMNISVKTVENHMGIAFHKLREYAVPRYNKTLS